MCVCVRACATQTPGLGQTWLKEFQLASLRPMQSLCNTHAQTHTKADAHARAHTFPQLLQLRRTIKMLCVTNPNGHHVRTLRGVLASIPPPRASWVMRSFSVEVRECRIVVLNKQQFMWVCRSRAVARWVFDGFVQSRRICLGLGSEHRCTPTADVS